MLKLPYLILSELEADNSRLVKEAIIAREASLNHVEFFAGIKLALDCMVTFGVKQIPEKKDESGIGLAWVDFIDVATCLANRSLTGHAARDAILSLMSKATKSEWNGWYRRILMKDLRAGFSETTVNKMVGKKHPQFSIPVFSCQLAHDGANHSSKLTGKKIIQSKMDGVRVLTIAYTSGHVVQFSRNGKELLNFPHIKEQFSAMAKRGLDHDMVFDGEVMSTSFQDLMKQVHRKSDVKSGDATLHLFDMIPLVDFERGVSSTTQISRDAALDEWFNKNLDLMPNVHVLSKN